MIINSNILIILLLSIIQGLTEFLPISSTAHMIIVSKLLNLPNNQFFNMFNIIVQLGSVCAGCIFFHKTIYNIIYNTLKYNKNKINLLHILITIMPIIIIGIIFYHKIKKIMSITNTIYGMILGSIYIYISEIIKPKKYKIYNINCLKYKLLFIIGCFQCLAFLPGFSRSGSVLSISLIMGLTRYIATELCFVIAIPVIFGASCLELYKNFIFLNIYNIKILILSFFISFITSFCTIRLSLFLIHYMSWRYFAIYRIIIAIMIYIYIM
ncbi:undecaprenyl-diphosphate phosphatase [Enterobacteriaceae endosymbiont of Neohaemonia nigricornis]|uniref:undecaprenyl-diphosphate phosphatase n=1 Tax=Enterobacteriaceae endosymbiont of Neohaemonia nigricornis TaxID=2675792 RepID=UPI001448FD47|nr:undecaprenyl-diphosphate phosphatase [Enterobacteriaceae endosymbiont of Neohaemonia nigricornis]QJC30431.1 undecaprenyl-diphosphatase [Enterobacteriaceae endosymbiont of Neohaemonia nigricornis]